MQVPIEIVIVPSSSSYHIEESNKKKLRIRNVGNKMKIFSFFFLDHEYLSSWLKSADEIQSLSNLGRLALHSSDW